MLPAYIPSRGIRRIPFLQNFLPEYQIQSTLNGSKAVIGWGLRPTTEKARSVAAKEKLPFIALEDGFLRSIGLGVTGYPPFSMVVDNIGIYYDTSKPSKLEQLVLNADSISSDTLDQAKQAIDLILEKNLSKYNHAPDYSNILTTKISSKNIVLLIDQTFGDMALKYGGADETTFVQMFQTALTENPGATIMIKTHPDVLCGKKQGYLTNLANQNRIHLLAEDINPISLLKSVNKVYCVTSQMGFEALLCGKPVTTFGLPWYAGWGLTDDRHQSVKEWVKQGRRISRSLLQLFTAAYLQYSRYINPNTGKPGNIFDVIDYLSAAKRLNDKLRGEIYCVGMSLWKRAVIKPFFNLPSCHLNFIRSISQIQKMDLTHNAKLLVWGNGKDALIKLATQKNLPVVHMEDGFIRSVGLGSNLVPPLSLVIDQKGIYFNPQKPSELETILQNQVFNQRDIQIALQLKIALTEHNISKYNVGRQHFNRPKTNKKILLVPGQVEDDASIRYGSPKIFRNLDLLKIVREQNPDAYIIYKPHPDVVSGNRVGHIEVKDTNQLANEVATETDILSCLAIADEVHTMTSLTGFEALLRNKKVYCYGLPFYSNWGLTNDFLKLPRRTRHLRLEELIAGTLVYYPNYIHPETRQLINARTAIEILKQQKDSQKNNIQLHRNWLAKQIGKVTQLWLSFKK